MEPFELTVMRDAARTVARWREMWGDQEAREMVVERLSGIYHDHDDGGDPMYRAAYLTAFGR